MAQKCLADYDPKSKKAINLNNPSEVKELARTNPAHYEKIQKILYAHSIKSERAVYKWMKASMKASDISYSSYVLTSLPAKKHLSFTLDQNRYTATVTME